MSRRRPRFLYARQRSMEHKDCKNIYIGKLIQQKVDERRMSYAEFARLVHCGRTNIYRLFNSKSIDIERLLLISDILDYDFIHEVYFAQAPSSQLPPHLMGQLRDFFLSESAD